MLLFSYFWGQEWNFPFLCQSKEGLVCYVDETLVPARTEDGVGTFLDYKNNNNIYNWMTN